ncbi:BQ5605_C002g01552 [Microbotryum silenes-dioicae]|uniref:BQ5605_C002g01552 protein n=1 Tax=Microbotryum silenes-dioicae TaxID=796604 RepID=A0A2X0M2T7_9BASI|nr:BQ5605_C002g01552 [Microbotryum silenes-dioicae]
MASYLRLPFGSSASSSSAAGSGSASSAHRARTVPTPDFGAFDLEHDDEDGSDEDGDDHHEGRHMLSTSHLTATQAGLIRLGDDTTDPLTQHQRQHIGGDRSSTAATVNHHATSSSPTATSTITRIPGAYDFEPQPHHGGGGGGSAGTPLSPQPRLGRVVSHSGLGGMGMSANNPSGNDANNRDTRLLRNRFMPSALYARINRSDMDDSPEQDGLLFDQDEVDSEHRTSTTSPMASTYPPSRVPGIGSLHVPLPARAPQFGAPTPSSGAGGRIYGGGQANDGVFGNLSAKPDGYPRGSDYVGGDESGGDKDEILPSYTAAALDSTPPYWETTVVTPGGVLGPDDIHVDGLPVGNLFGFMWNLLVSMSFQFVGFLLTYLLHTTHAAKHGSRAGLGITMMQLGFYLKQQADHPELLMMQINGSMPNPMDVPMDDGAGTRWSWWGGVSTDAIDGLNETVAATATATSAAFGSIPTQIGNGISGALNASDPDGFPSLTGNVNAEDFVRMSTNANEWMAFIMVTIGAFLFVGGCLSYWRAVRWARAISQNRGPGMTEA